MAAAMGSPLFHHTIHPPLTLPRRGGLRFAEALEAALPLVRGLCEYAAERNVLCVYEDQGMYFNGCDHFGRFTEALDGTPFGVVADLGNILFVDELPGVITILGTFAFMLSVNGSITLVVVLVTPVSLLAAAVIAKKTYSMFTLQSVTPERPPRVSNMPHGFVQPFSDSPLDGESVGDTVFFNLITKARRSVYIMTPYLVISDKMISALSVAAKNGVDVRG